MRKLKLRVGGLELEYECEPEELPTIVSGVLKAVGPELLQNGGGERATRDPPQRMEVMIYGLVTGDKYEPLHVKLVR